MPFDVRRWVRSFLSLWFGRRRFDGGGVDTPERCEWNNGWPSITKMGGLVKVSPQVLRVHFTKGSHRLTRRRMKECFFSLRRRNDAELRSTCASFCLRMCTFQHHFPHTRVWVSDVDQHHDLYLDKTHVSSENKEQLPSHFKELITVVAEAHTWITATRPVQSHLQVSIEHTLPKQMDRMLLPANSKEFEAAG